MTNIATKKFSEEEINFLAQKLKENPSSPLFARLADGLLQLNKLDEALALCENGISLYPEYVSGYVVLGKIHLKKGNYTFAKNNFLIAIQKSPTNTFAAKLIEAIPAEEEVKEVVKTFPTFEEFEKENPLQTSEAELISLESFLYSGETKNDSENIEEMDELAQLLSSAEKISPTEVTTDENLPDIDQFEPSIVTPTLAEIYASQEQFADAIELYKTLIERRPKEKLEFEKRISELKTLASEIAKPKKEGK